ncbi:MAG: type II toxin-antitoxin system VapC family toxin [Acetobacteraceae bacterium]
MSLVLDASLTLSWYFEEERTPAVDAVLEQVTENGAWVASLWRLQVALRRNRPDISFRDKALAELSRMPVTIDSDTAVYAWSATLRRAERSRLTLYDAAYLEPSERRHLALASLDQPLRAAAGALSLELLGMAN